MTKRYKFLIVFLLCHTICSRSEAHSERVTLSSNLVREFVRDQARWFETTVGIDIDNTELSYADRPYVVSGFPVILLKSQYRIDYDVNLKRPVVIAYCPKNILTSNQNNFVSPKSVMISMYRPQIKHLQKILDAANVNSQTLGTTDFEISDKSGDKIIVSRRFLKEATQVGKIEAEWNQKLEHVQLKILAFGPSSAIVSNADSSGEFERQLPLGGEVIYRKNKSQEDFTTYVLGYQVPIASDSPIYVGPEVGITKQQDYWSSETTLGEYGGVGIRLKLGP
jgi:hypothetical protein